MIYVAINEQKAPGKALVEFLRGIEKDNDFVNFMNHEKELEFAINDAMQSPRVRSGNSLREILQENGI